MVKVKITGWKYGLQKVSLDRLLSQKVGWTLKEAFDAVNNLLAGQEVEVVLEICEEAVRFAHEAESIGAVCEIESDCES